MDEQQLVSALIARDPAALQELVASCGRRLFRSAVLLCGNETDAEDLVQETFLQAVKSIHRFRRESSLHTWLHAILLNLTRRHRRDRSRLIADDQLARRDVPAPEPDPAAADAPAVSAAVSAALHHLSPPHREVLVLRYYEDLKIHQISALLEIPPGTVKSRLHYALMEMQRLLPAGMNLFRAEGTNQTETR